MRPLGDIVTLVLTVVAAAAIGFGVPAGWVWIGSQLQGGSGASSLDFSVAVATLAGMIATYVVILWLAGWVMTRIDPTVQDARRRGTASEPWMRGMTDSRSVSKGRPSPATAIERVFVVTTVVVSAAVFVWFFFFAEGGGLPSQ